MNGEGRKDLSLGKSFKRRTPRRGDEKCAAGPCEQNHYEANLLSFDVSSLPKNLNLERSRDGGKEVGGQLKSRHCSKKLRVLRAEHLTNFPGSAFGSRIRKIGREGDHKFIREKIHQFKILNEICKKSRRIPVYKPKEGPEQNSERKRRESPGGEKKSNLAGNTPSRPGSEISLKSKHVCSTFLAEVGSVKNEL